MSELMLSRAILEDGFTPVLRKIAGEQDAYARKTAQLNGLGNIFIGAGSAAVAFAVKSVKVAGDLDAIKRSMAAVEGQQAATWDMAYIDKFAQHSKFTYMDLAESGKRLALAGVPVKDYLSDIADLAASSQKPLAQVAKLYDTLLGGHNVSLALSARGGFSQFYISPDKIFAAAGKEYIPGKTKLVGSMTPEEVAQAVHKVLMSTNRAGLNEKLARTTLEGTEGMIQDAVTRIGNNVASGQNLADTVKLLGTIADDLNRIADIAAKIPNLGEKILGAGAGMILIGGLAKGLAAFRDYKNMVNLAKIAGDAERKGEGDKVGIAGAEGRAVDGVAGKYGGLRGILTKVGTATLGQGAATASATRIMAAGLGTLGLYAVALAGIVAVGYEVVGMFSAMNQASRDFEASIAAVDKAKSEGYDLKSDAGKAEGFTALPVWKQVVSTFGHSGWGAMINPLLAGYGASMPDADTMGSSALIDKATIGLAKKHGMAKHGVRAQQIYAQQQKAEAAREAARQAAAEKAAAAGQAANSYQLDPALDFRLKSDERRIDLLKEMGGHEKELAAARKQEISDLGTAAGLLEHQAALATDMKAKYDLLNQAADDRQKAKLLGIEGTKDKRDKLDKTIATILGAGGLDDSEIMKRAGIGGGFFARLKGGKNGLPENPMKSVLTALLKRPLVLNVHLGDKPFAQIKTEIKDEVASDWLRIFETSQTQGLFGSH